MNRGIKYSKDVFLSPTEILEIGLGNCSSKSALLASLLKTIGLYVRIATTENHCFVMVRYRIHGFQQFPDTDYLGYSMRDFIPLDPASNCPFRIMPESNYNIGIINHDF